MATEVQPPGKVITFYSYKGGTGRTMALANVACVLAQQQRAKPVLMVDWDLEAPGLHRYFRPYVSRHFGNAQDAETTFDQRPGLLELLEWINQQIVARPGADEPLGEGDVQEILGGLTLDEYVIPTDLGYVSLLKGGRFDATFSARVHAFPWDGLYRRSPSVYRCLAERLTRDYSHVLIDSRTGATDIGSVCTMLMPEVLVVVFTPNRQSLTGVLNLVRQATDTRRSSDDLRPLVVFPLASRVETTLYDLYRRWRNGDTGTGIEGYQPLFEKLLKDVYGLGECNLESYFDEVQIQHIPEYAYGEEIAVMTEQKRGRLFLRRSYELFAERLENQGGPWEEFQLGNEAVWTMSEHRVRAVAVTGDGRRGVVSSADKTLAVWDIPSRRKVRTLRWHTDEVRSVAVLADGRRAVSASHDATLVLWDLEDGTNLRTFRGHTEKVRAVVITPDQRRIISGSGDWTIKVWELETGRQVQTLVGHENLVNAVAVSPDGCRLLTASDDKTLRLWNLSDGSELRVLHGHTDYVLKVAFIGDGSRAISASFDRTLKVWDVATGLEVRSLTGHGREVRDVAVTPDGDRVASASYDETVKVWDLQIGAVLETFHGSSGFTACAFTPDARTLIAGDLVGKIHFFPLGEPLSARP